VASKYGISISDITFKDDSSSSGSTIADAAPSQPYQSSAIGFSFSATYDKFNSFMGDLEKSLRILDIKTTKLTVKPDGTALYDVQFETYWLK
jgi:hypothetical protein